MELRDALSVPIFAGLSADDALTAGNRIIVTTGDTTLRNTAYVRGLLAAQDLATVQATVFAAIQAQSSLAVWQVLIQLNTVGINFADANNRAVIQGLASAGKWSSQLTNTILGIGASTSQTWWASRGVDQPTVDDIAVAQKGNDSQQKWQQVLYEIVPTMLTAGNTWDEIKSAISKV